MVRSWKIAACSIVLTSVLAACGGGNDSTSAGQTGRPAAWAKDICVALNSFNSAGEVRGRQMQNQVAAATSVKEVRTNIGAVSWRPRRPN